MELREEHVTLVLLGILFIAESPEGLASSTETINAHTAICHNKLEVHIEINLSKRLDKDALKALAT